MAFIHDISERAYLAGIVDGEGCILIDRNEDKRSGRVYHRLRVTINNTFVPLMEWIETQWPAGSVAWSNPYQKNGGMPVLTYTITGRKAAAMLDELLPWLLVKRRQAELGVQFAATLVDKSGPGLRLPDNVIAFRESARREMQGLKKETA